jgi:WD40 repeat protein
MANAELYTVGGTVQAGAGVYIPRQADELLLKLCQAGELAYVLTARQMGKSSLMIQTATRLAEAGITPIIVDLNQLGSQLAAKAWFLGFLVALEENVSLESDILDWWQAHGRLGLAQRLILFCKEALLTEIKGPIVIFVDEIDTTLTLDFADDFFAAIRAMYNARATTPEFQHLSFVLIGVATPDELISDPKRTPFNIGRRVDLTDFTFKEARPLAQGLGLPRSQSLAVLGWVLKWTGGHPYLTQRLCQVIAAQGRPDWTEARVDEVVQEVFLGEAGSQDHNLQFVRDMLTRRAPDMAGVLSLYRAIRANLYVVPDEEHSPVVSHLKLSGLVHRVGDHLSVRNLIYATVFDLKWIEEVEARSQVADPLELARLRALAEAQQQQAEAERQRAEAQMRRAEEEQRRATAERQRAEIERQRALEQLRATAQLRRRALWLSGALTLMMIAVIMAILFGVQAQSQAEEARSAAIQQATARSEADANLVTAQFRATQETIARNEAAANLATVQFQAVQVAAFGTEQVRATEVAQARATAEAGATQEAIARQNAVAAQSTAEFQATLEAVARSNAQVEATRSRNAEATAQAEAGRAGQSQATAEQEAERARRAEKDAEQERATAEAEATRAIEAEETAEAERATAEIRTTEVARARQTAEAQGTLEAIARATAEAGATQEALARATATAAVATAEAERDRANTEARLANSRQLAGRVGELPDNQYDLALLLSLEANRIADTAEARSSLVETLQKNSQLSRFLYSHDNSVQSVAFSPDGQVLASGSSDSQIRLWEVNSGQVVAIIAGHTDVVWNVAFSPSSSILASASADDTIRLWDTGDAQNPQLLSQLTEHLEDVLNVAFNREGNLLASASADDTVILWDVANPQQPQRLSQLAGHADDVWSVAFSPTTPLLATAGNDQQIILWDIIEPENPKLLAQFTNHSGPVVSLAFRPDGQLLASASEDATISLWNLAEPQQPEFLSQLTDHVSSVFSLAFNGDGQTLASGSADQTIILWDVADPRSPTLQTRLADHSSFVYSLAFAADGRTLASGSADRTIRLWDTLAGSRLGQLLLEHTGLVGKVVFSPNNQVMASTSLDPNGAEEAIILWDAADPGNLQPIAHLVGFDAFTLAFSPDGTVLASGGLDGSISLWAVSDPTQPELLSQQSGHASVVRSLAFNHGGQLLASGSSDDSIILWEVGNPRQPEPLSQIFPAHQGQVFSLAFSPNTSQPVLASGGADQSLGGTPRVILWDVADPASPAPLAELTGHIDHILSVGFSPDGTMLASGSVDRNVLLWDVTSPTQPGRLARLAGHDNWVWSVAFSPDGQTLAVGSADQTISLWRVDQPEQIGRLTGHSGPVLSVAFRDAQTLASGSSDQSIMVWNIDFQSYDVLVCRIANRNLTQIELGQYIPEDFQSDTGACPGLPYPAPEISSVQDLPLPVPMTTATPPIFFTPTLAAETPTATATATPESSPTATMTPAPESSPTPTPAPSFTATITPTPSITAETVVSTQ